MDYSTDIGKKIEYQLIFLIDHVTILVKKLINIFFELDQRWLIDVVHVPSLVEVKLNILLEFRTKKQVLNIIPCNVIWCSKIKIASPNIDFQGGVFGHS